MKNEIYFLHIPESTEKIWIPWHDATLLKISNNKKKTEKKKFKRDQSFSQRYFQAMDWMICYDFKWIRYLYDEGHQRKNGIFSYN